ncbi:MAG: MvdC/MvdD family ATP grasp protein [Paracoccaceae bacterium]
MILILSHRGDQHAVVVLEQLTKNRVPAAMFDTAVFPNNASLSIHQTGGGQQADLSFEGANLDMGSVRRVWWRRPRGFTPDAALTRPEDFNFVHNESHAAIGGLWRSLDAEWINDPLLDEAAARKVWQLKVANELGLRTPKTLITNDNQAAMRFVEAQGNKGTIYKAFTATEEDWRETRLLKPEEKRELDQVKYAPVIFQEYIKADIDLRITMIGEDIFPAAVYSGETEYKVDFRMTFHDARVEAHVLPDEIVTKLRKLMKKLGLIYGAIDMRLTPHGEYVFLEINPSGQWLFIEDRTGQKMTDAFVSRLMAPS